MTGYVLSADADFDLDGIWEYIAEDDLDAADRWLGKLFDAFEALGKNPGLGHRREDLTTYEVLRAGGCLPHHLSQGTHNHRDRGGDARLTRRTCISESTIASLITLRTIDVRYEVDVRQKHHE